MIRRFLGVMLFLCFFVAASLAQSGPCVLSDHTEYTKKIKEFTTASYFSTELVDHLPISSCVPPPDVSLHHIVGGPDVLDYTKDINAYFRLLASPKSPPSSMCPTAGATWFSLPTTPCGAVKPWAVISWSSMPCSTLIISTSAPLPSRANSCPEDPCQNHAGTS